MRIVEAEFHNAIQANGGLYVLIEGSKDDLTSSAVDQLAIKTAFDKGWNGHGKSTVNNPIRVGVVTYSKAYWFHDPLH